MEPTPAIPKSGVISFRSSRGEIVYARNRLIELEAEVQKEIGKLSYRRDALAGAIALLEEWLKEVRQ